MELPVREVCYRALQSRDARFDGLMFVGVSTTGIYCRPICPARTPKFENCNFFGSAAAAQDAGFRPCLRCRPEIAPDLASWRGTSNTVSRALALIADGALDDEQSSVAKLAERLGLGERQLRRLFLQHLGASPISVAQTRRVLFAKQLIHETRMPMTQVALASGFSSIRRFNRLRKSPHGNKSLLIVSWDEHGGFYDHVAPPSAVAPGDAGSGSTYNKHGFTFEQLGVRVPAVVVSPWIPQNRIDHQLYDHASIPATLQQLFGIPTLTNRDAAATDVTPLLSLPALRTDTPITLPNPAFPVAPPIAQRALPPENSVNTRSLPGFLNLAMRRDMAMSDPAAQPAIVARVRAIQTRGEPARYIQQVQAKMRAAGQSLA